MNKVIWGIVLFLLVSCTEPKMVYMEDKNGQIIHSVQKEPFFNSPDKTSEWLFWYTPIFLFASWFIWREAKSIYYDCKKVKNPEDEEINNP
jgi:hypothetical protein